LPISPSGLKETADFRVAKAGLDECLRYFEVLAAVEHVIHYDDHWARCGSGLIPELRDSA
jgi:hypothetical protein